MGGMERGLGGASEEDVELCFLCGSMAIMFTLYFSNILHVLKVSWIPESLVAVLFGAGLGFVLWMSPFFGGRANHLPYEREYKYFALYLKLLGLPLIIFEAGWSLKLRDFFSQLSYILIFAILGTVISICLIAGLMVATAEYHGIGNLKLALAYASLISSVDPVATLATFGHLNVDRLLFILVFGESQINDAVAITLFDAFNAPSYGQSSVWTLVAKTMLYLFGSIALGIGLAILFLLALRLGRTRHSPHEVIIFLTVSSTFIYQVSEFMKLSGIITVLFCSIFLSAYIGPHLNTEGTVFCSFLLKQLSSICDMIIFIFVGVQAVMVGWNDIGVSLWVMLFVLVSRAVAVCLLGLACNALKALVSKRLPAENRHFISWKHMVMMWHGGVCRGGVSLWMATELGSWVDIDGGEHTRHKLIAATFNLICCFLLVFGGTTSLVMRWLQLPMGDQVPPDLTLYGPQDKTSLGYRAGLWLHHKALVPLLVGRQCMQEVTRVKSESDEVGVSVHQRRPVRRRTTTVSFELFGTDDPAHLEQMEDIMEEEDHGGASSTETESDA